MPLLKKAKWKLVEMKLLDGFFKFKVIKVALEVDRRLLGSFCLAVTRFFSSENPKYFSINFQN
jgi:hypothetical protein